jgi:gag-polypeptide of LTR copia-type
MKNFLCEISSALHLLPNCSTFLTPNQTIQISTFLRPNIDFSASQKLINALLNDKNYILWAKTVRVTLKGKRLFGYVNGSRVRPIERE